MLSVVTNFSNYGFGVTKEGWPRARFPRTCFLDPFGHAATDQAGVLSQGLRPLFACSHNLRFDTLKALRRTREEGKE